MYTVEKADSKYPDGIKFSGKLHYVKNTITGVENGKEHQNTFDCKESHEILDGVGVKFNVETLPEAFDKHLKKSELNRQNLFDKICRVSSEFYAEEYKVKGKKPKIEAKNLRLESVSVPEESLVYAGGDGFFRCCLTAFAQHLPLKLSPDHFWTLITYAFAKHVDQNSEKLRKKFVKHEGKVRLRFETKPSFKMSKSGKPDTGEKSKTWEKEIFSTFSGLIKEHIGNEVHSKIVADFSTTTEVSKAASEITLMSAMKNFFSYGMVTRCGIPEVTLMGNLQDWVSLRQKTEELGELMLPSFKKRWLRLLLPVLDKFVEAYEGKVHHGFWQSMVKLRSSGNGSGAYNFISGWIQLFYPILATGKVNTKLKSWEKMYFVGPKPEEIPTTISSAPVDWEYHSVVFDLHFHAGFIGFSQTEGTLSPTLGWYVTHDPAAPSEYLVDKIQQEIEDLFKGHIKEFKSGNYNEKTPWVERILALKINETKVLPKLSGILRKEAEERKTKRHKLKAF